MDVNKLMKKSLSCFYCFCVDGNFLACDNIPWTKDWEVEMLIPSNTTFVREAMLVAFDEDTWDRYGVNSDYFASYLAFGDNFAMNVEGVDFYILMCTKTMYILQKPYKCAWGQQFNVSDIVVTHRYYQKWGQS
jgi:hypothetical protein